MNSKIVPILAIGILGMLSRPASAQRADKPFADVQTDHWSNLAIENLREKGIIVGYPDGTFRSKRTITRYEVATAIERMLRAAPHARAGAPGEKGEPGPVGPKGDKGPQGEPGPKGQPPVEVSEFRTLLEQMHREIVDLRKELGAAGTKMDGVSTDAQKLKRDLKPIKTGK